MEYIQTESEGTENGLHVNGIQKKAEAVLGSDKADFKVKTVTRDKGGYYIMIKGSIKEHDVTR